MQHSNYCLNQCLLSTNSCYSTDMTTQTDRPETARRIQRILVGVDGSDPSVGAAEWAAALAQRINADVVLIDVLDRPYSEITPEVDRAFREEAQQEVAEDIAGDDPLADAEIITAEDDDPPFTLAAAAKSADLMVIGSREREGRGSHGFFSLAHSLAHHVPCPMVVVPQGSPPVQAEPRIVIGVDGSKGNKVAFAWTLGLAASIGAHVTAVFVTDPIYDTFDAEGSYGPEEVAAEEEAGHVVSVTYTEVSGNDAAATLRQLVTDNSADLLVVGARSRHALGGLFLGKIPDQLLHQPNCPTVIVPHGFRNPSGTPS